MVDTLGRRESKGPKWFWACPPIMKGGYGGWNSNHLKDVYEGNPPSVFTVGADALKAIPANQELTLLELGCVFSEKKDAVELRRQNAVLASCGYRIR
jgi:hypothetical protein